MLGLSDCSHHTHIGVRGYIISDTERLMGDFSDYEMNEMVARDNAADDRQDIIRKRYAAQNQPPYSIVLEHRIDRVVMGADLQEYVWCKCKEKFTVSMHMFHVRNAMLDEMIGQVDSFGGV